jgi:hypothetical protein
MEHEHEPAAARAAAGDPPPAAASIDLDKLLALGQVLIGKLGEGGLPPWAKWAAGAACVGAAFGLVYGDPKPTVTVTTDPGKPTSTPAGPDAVPRTQVLHTMRDIREYPLGFFLSGIGVCTGAVDVVSRPQIPFLGERLIIPSLIAGSFSLIDIRVRNRSQLANSTAIPARAFQENSRGVKVALDPAWIADHVTLVVENLTEDAQTFMAALIGTAISPCEECGGYGTYEDFKNNYA